MSDDPNLPPENIPAILREQTKGAEAEAITERQPGARTRARRRDTKLDAADVIARRQRPRANRQQGRPHVAPRPQDEVIPHESLDVIGDIPDPKVGRPLGTLLSDEIVRAGLAIVFAIIFAITVFTAFSKTDTPAAWTNTKELLQLLIPAETALLGSTVGFYFGTKSKL